MSESAGLRQPGRRRAGRLALAASGLVAVGALLGGPAAAQSWQESDSGKVRTRLVTGSASLADGSTQPYAGLQVKMEPGWKTYWRSLGDAGGIPPYFDFSGSENLKSAKVAFPAPKRFVESVGTTFGYKKEVTFPIAVTPSDPAQPVVLRVSVDFGICEEICVPASARHEARFVPDGVSFLPGPLAVALEQVPVAAGSAQAATAGVRLEGATAIMSGEEPHVTFKIATDDPDASDLFVEAPAGLFIGVANRTGQTGNVVSFRANLLAPEDAAKFKGKPLRLTLIGPGGAVDQAWTVPN